MRPVRAHDQLQPRSLQRLALLVMVSAVLSCETAVNDRRSSQSKAAKPSNLNVIEEQTLNIEPGKAQSVVVGRTTVNVPGNYVSDAESTNLQVRIRRVTVPNDIDRETAVSLGQAEELIEFETVDLSTQKRITSDRILAPLEFSQRLNTDTEELALLVLLANEGDNALHLTGGFVYSDAAQFAVRKPALRVESRVDGLHVSAHLQEANFLGAAIPLAMVAASVQDYPSFDQKTGTITQRARTESATTTSSTSTSTTGTGSTTARFHQTDPGDFTPSYFMVGPQGRGCWLISRGVSSCQVLV